MRNLSLYQVDAREFSLLNIEQEIQDAKIKEMLKEYPYLRMCIDLGNKSIR